MYEITIDMSPCESPESAHKLLPDKVTHKSCFSPPSYQLNEQECESTADTYSNFQPELRLQLLPIIIPHSVYSDEILEHLTQQQEKLQILSSEGILKNHKITAELRAKMVDWIIEVTYKAECTPQTLFLSVNVIDRFLQHTDQCYKSAEMHMIGVVAMLLASKFEEVAGMDIGFMYEQVVHKKISTKEMADFEIKIMEGIDFTVSAPTELDFLEAFYENLGEYATGDVIALAKYIAVLNLHSLELAAVKPSAKAAASLFLAVKNAAVVPLEEVWKKLVNLSGASAKQMEEVVKKVEQHKSEFKKLHPKLKNVHNYVPQGL